LKPLKFNNLIFSHSFNLNKARRPLKEFTAQRAKKMVQPKASLLFEKKAPCGDIDYIQVKQADGPDQKVQKTKDHTDEGKVTEQNVSTAAGGKCKESILVSTGKGPYW
jgi:hypothetical protein